MESFKEYREAARHGITNAGGDPVLAEDFPSLPLSPRNACLDGVASSDIFLIVVGSRGGWAAPSGKLVVEEEFEEAQRLKLPVFGFIQSTARDEAAENLFKKLSDYIDGIYRLTFTSPDDLTTSIEKTLSPVVTKYKAPEINERRIQEILTNLLDIRSQATLRFVLSPERISELIDPVFLEADELENELYGIGHSPQVRLFSYKHAKEDKKVSTDAVILSQAQERASPNIFSMVRLELSTVGTIVLDLNVTGSRDDGLDYGLAEYMTIAEQDIAEGLRRCFSFAKAFYSLRDPYTRYNRLLYNSALGGVSRRTLIPKLEKMDSLQVPFGEEDRSIIAFDRPRVITRADLDVFDKLISDTIAMLRRRLKSRI